MKFPPRKHQRFRLTKSTIRFQQDNMKLVDLFENRKAVLASERSEPGINAPSQLATATREYHMLRNELMRRAFPAELLDEVAA